MLIQVKIMKFKKKYKINMPLSQFQNIINKNNAEEWFIYAYKDWGKRGHITKPCYWVLSRISKNADILETGCGCGLNLIWLGQQGFMNLYGTDISKNAIKAGKELSKLTKISMNFAVENSLKPKNIFKKKFDLIFAFSWTYLLDEFDLSSFLKKYSSQLNNNGLIIIETIDSAYNKIKNNEYNINDWSKPVMKRKKTEYKQRYSINEVKKIITKNNFTIMKIFKERELLKRFLNIFLHKYKTIPRTVYILKKL